MARPSALNRFVQTTTSVLVSLVGGWVLYSKVIVDHHLPLDEAIDAERERLIGKNTHLLSYYVDRAGEYPKLPPLVLIHSINAAGCAFEMRPIFEAYRGTRDIYALDLPGFGFSERSDRVYSYDLYKEAIIDLLTRIGAQADVIALSLTCEFAARAALECPELFRSLTMISPSGFTARADKGASQAASQSGTSDTLYKLFSFPLWSEAFYDLVATRKSIHYFLQLSFDGQVDPELEAYGYATTHQPGARFAPLYFVSGKLFSPGIRDEVYAKLSLPVLVLYDRDAFVRFDTLPGFVDQHANWRTVRIEPSKGLPQFEQMPQVGHELDSFWERVATQ